MLLALQSLMLDETPVPISPAWLLIAPKRRFLFAAPRRVFKLVAGASPFAGDFSPFNPVEAVSLSIDFSALAAEGDSVNSEAAQPSSDVSVYMGDDPDAAALLVTRGYAGFVVTLGLKQGAVGGVAYRFTMRLATTKGLTLSAFAHAFCTPGIVLTSDLASPPSGL